MNMRQLKTLIAIYEYGNLAKAADAIALTPSAVSQQMTSLEDEVGSPLFDRSTRPPTLTYQGIQLLEAAKIITQTADRVLGSITGNNMIGALNLGAVRSSIFGILPKALVDLRQKYPLLKINLRMGKTEDLMYDVSVGRLDAAVIAEAHSVLPNLIFSPFIEDPLYAIAKKGSTYTDVRELLTSAEYIHFHSNVPLALLIDTELNKQNIKFRSSIQIDSIFGIIQCVANGLGVSVVPYSALAQPFKTDVHILPFGEPQVCRRVGIVHIKNSPKDILIEKLHEKLASFSAPYEIFRQPKEPS